MIRLMITMSLMMVYLNALTDHGVKGCTYNTVTLICETIIKC